MQRKGGKQDLECPSRIELTALRIGTKSVGQFSVTLSTVKRSLARSCQAHAHARSVPPLGSIVLPEDSDDGLRRLPWVFAHAHFVGEVGLVLDDVRPLQLLEQTRHVAPVRALAVVLVGRHPIVISLPPLLRDLRLSVRVDAVFVGELGGSLCRVASALEIY